MGARDVGRRMLVGLTILILLTGCSSSATPAAGGAAAGASPPLIYDPGANPQADIDAAVAAAKADGRRVLIEFGADWEDDCAALAADFASPQIKPFLDANFHVVHVYIGRWNANQAVQNKYRAGGVGMPMIAVLDGTGANLYQSAALNSAASLSIADVMTSLQTWAPPRTATTSAMPSATPPPATPAPSPSQSDLAAGTMVDVGGYSLYVQCAGTGSPTIVWEAGATDDSSTVAVYLSQLASVSRTCIYDRAGHGRSQDSPLGLGATESHWSLTVTNLHKLLVNAGISGPYVMAGHSQGGLYARMFAAAYPNNVVGVVLVDAVNEDLYSDASIKSCPQHPPVWGCSATDDPGSWPWAGHPSDRAADLAYVEQLTHGQVAGSLGALPLVVLSHDPALAPMGQAFEPVWTTAQQALATASSNSIRAVAVNSPHYIMDAQPKLVIEALREVVAAARASDHTLPPFGSALTQVGGECQ